MMTEQDIERVMPTRLTNAESFIEADDYDYDFDEDDEQELIELLHMESLEDDLDDDMNCGI